MLSSLYNKSLATKHLLGHAAATSNTWYWHAAASLLVLAAAPALPHTGSIDTMNTLNNTTTSTHHERKAEAERGEGWGEKRDGGKGERGTERVRCLCATPGAGARDEHLVRSPLQLRSTFSSGPKRGCQRILNTPQSTLIEKDSYMHHLTVQLRRSQAVLAGRHPR